MRQQLLLLSLRQHPVHGSLLDGAAGRRLGMRNDNVFCPFGSHRPATRVRSRQKGLRQHGPCLGGAIAVLVGVEVALDGRQVQQREVVVLLREAQVLEGTRQCIFGSLPAEFTLFTLFFQLGMSGVNEPGLKKRNWLQQRALACKHIRTFLAQTSNVCPVLTL